MADQNLDFLHANEWDMGHWPIFMALSYYGPKISLEYHNVQGFVTTEDLHFFKKRTYFVKKYFPIDYLQKLVMAITIKVCKNVQITCIISKYLPQANQANSAYLKHRVLA